MSTGKSQSAGPSLQSVLLARLKSLPARAREWRRRHPRATTAALGLALLAVPIAGTLLLNGARSHTPRPVIVAPRVNIAQALAALDRGAFAEARKLADDLKRELPRPYPPSGPAFIYGAAAARETDEFWGLDRKRHATAASGYLQEARSLGFPEERVAQGLYLLGKSLDAAGRLQDCRPVLEEALKEGSTETSDIHWLLSIAYRDGESPDLKRALEHIGAYLADPALDASKRYTGLLAQGELLWQLGEFDRCRETVAKIPPQATAFAQATTLQGRLLMDDARRLKQVLQPNDPPEARQAVTKKYEEAIATLRRAQIDPFETGAICKSMYLIGVCFLEMEDYRAALAQFTRTRDVYLDSPEGLAAGLQEADLLREMDRQDEATIAYERVLDAVGDPAEFVNSWIPLDKFRQRVTAAYHAYVEGGQFARGIEIADHMSPLLPRARAVELAAEAHRQWARRLIAQAETLAEPKASETLQEGRALMRKAGRIFTELAGLEFSTRRYPDDLWHAAQSYLEGQNFSAAVRAFDEYMKNELRARRPLALVGTGQALLALGRFDDSLAALKECIEYYPADASSYRARWLAAKAYLEKGDTAAAEKLLRENLSGENLTPASKEWRDSLFTLGRLLAGEKRYEEAIQSLEEAVARYGDTREATAARYTIAESYRQSARVPQEKLLSDTIETTRAAHRRQIQQCLSAAIANYEQVQQTLNRRQETMELSPLEKANLRNSYFAVGAALFDLGRYEEAIRAYSTATNRYQHDPEVLEAFVQIAGCYRRLNKPLEARGTVQQAKMVMNRIPQDAAFTKVTNYNRREWIDLLDWLSTL